MTGTWDDAYKIMQEKLPSYPPKLKRKASKYSKNVYHYKTEPITEQQMIDMVKEISIVSKWKIILVPFQTFNYTRRKIELGRDTSLHINEKAQGEFLKETLNLKAEFMIYNEFPNFVYVREPMIKEVK